MALKPGGAQGGIAIATRGARGGELLSSVRRSPTLSKKFYRVHGLDFEGSHGVVVTDCAVTRWT